VREKKNAQKESLIDIMSPEEIMNELKQRGLPTFGIHQERKDRLKKANGINLIV
jgi:hypothetical protein